VKRPQQEAGLPAQLGRIAGIQWQGGRHRRTSRSAAGPCGAGLPIAGRSLRWPGQAGNWRGTTITPYPTDKQSACWLNCTPVALELLAETASTAGWTRGYPILMASTDRHGLGECWIAWRLAVDL